MSLFSSILFISIAGTTEVLHFYPCILQLKITPSSKRLHDSPNYSLGLELNSTLSNFFFFSCFPLGLVTDCGKDIFMQFKNWVNANLALNFVCLLMGDCEMVERREGVKF